MRELSRFKSSLNHLLRLGWSYTLIFLSIFNRKICVTNTVIMNYYCRDTCIFVWFCSLCCITILSIIIRILFITMSRLINTCVICLLEHMLLFLFNYICFNIGTYDGSNWVFWFYTILIFHEITLVAFMVMFWVNTCKLKYLTFSLTE